MICNFYLSAAARNIARADPSVRYTSLLLGRSASKQATTKHVCDNSACVCHGRLQRVRHAISSDLKHNQTGTSDSVQAQDRPQPPPPSPVFQTPHWPYRAVPLRYWQSDNRTSTAVLPHLRATQKGNLARPHSRSPQAVRKPEGPAMHCHLHRGDWSFHLTNEKKKQKRRSFPQNPFYPCERSGQFRVDVFIFKGVGGGGGRLGKSSGSVFPIKKNVLACLFPRGKKSPRQILALLGCVKRASDLFCVLELRGSSASGQCRG